MTARQAERSSGQEAAIAAALLPEALKAYRRGNVPGRAMHDRNAE